MNEIFINKLRTIAITGHRTLYDGFNKEKLTKLLTKCVDKGFNTFLIGMAVGFDTICFQILEEIRKEKDVKLIACIPCPEQACKFSIKQKLEYERMVESADEKIILSDEYYSGCMQKRNRFMVDNCTGVLAYLKQEKGGTANTVNYARKKGIPVIIFE